MGHLMEAKLFQEADSCLDKINKNRESGSELECPMNHCEDTSEEFKVHDLAKASFNPNLEYNPQLVIVHAYLIADLLLNLTKKSNQPYLTYKPPSIDRDIPTLIQSFLI